MNNMATYCGQCGVLLNSTFGHSCPQYRQADTTIPDTVWIDTNKFLSGSVVQLEAEKAKLQSRIEKLEKALKHYTNCHDSGCSLAYTDNCDCEFPMWAKQALEEK